MFKITRIYLLPIINFIWFTITYFLPLDINYVIILYVNRENTFRYAPAVYFGHVHPLFPSISDNAMFSPGSCIFSQLVNIGCISMASIVYVRYRNVEELEKIHGFDWYIRDINCICLWIGILASFGISVFANFQQSTMLYVHLIGVGLGFGVGTLYQIIHTILCLHIGDKTGSALINVIRTLITSISCISAIVFLIFYTIFLRCNKTRKVTPEDAMFIPHLLSALAEWNMAFFNIGYFLTYTYEFRKITIYEPKIVFKKQLSNTSQS